jgi:hypothetical protein
MVWVGSYADPAGSPTTRLGCGEPVVVTLLDRFPR